MPEQIPEQMMNAEQSLEKAILDNKVEVSPVNVEMYNRITQLEETIKSMQINIVEVISKEVGKYIAQMKAEQDKVEFAKKNQAKIDEVVHRLGWEKYYIIDPMSKKTSKQLPPDQQKAVMDYIMAEGGNE